MAKGPQQGHEAFDATMRAGRVLALNKALAELRDAMHKAEGTIDPGEHQDHQWGSRHMALAATHLEIAEFFMFKAAGE